MKLKLQERLTYMGPFQDPQRGLGKGFIWSIVFVKSAEVKYFNQGS